MKERALVRLSYVLGSLLVVLPLVDLVANVWPFVPGDVNWRYGTYTLVSGFLMTPVIGFALLVGTATLTGGRRLARFSAICQWLLALGILTGTAIFILDAIQLAPTVPPEAGAQFRIGVGKALFKNPVLAGALIWIGVVGWRVRPRGRAQPPLFGAGENE